MMRETTITRTISFVNQKGELKDTSVVFRIEHEDDEVLNRTFTADNVSDMARSALGSLETCGGGISIQDQVFDVPKSELSRFSYVLQKRH